VAVLVVLVTTGPVPALIVLGVVIGVQQVEGNVLQPLLLGRAVKLNGVVVVLAVAVGSVVAGIAGALLAVPLLAMLNAGIRELVSDNAKAGEITNGRLKTGDVFSGANGKGVGTIGSAFPPADIPADPAGGSRNGAGAHHANAYRAGPNRTRSGPAHRRQDRAGGLTQERGE
ncbi:MAG: AI-2E family transporter, partial [Pseudonocardiaceae bacterium]